MWRIVWIGVDAGFENCSSQISDGGSLPTFSAVLHSESKDQIQSECLSKSFQPSIRDFPLRNSFAGDPLRFTIRNERGIQPENKINSLSIWKIIGLMRVRDVSYEPFDTEGLFACFLVRDDVHKAVVFHRTTRKMTHAVGSYV